PPGRPRDRPGSAIPLYPHRSGPFHRPTRGNRRRGKAGPSMTGPLVATKLYAPRRRQALVTRLRLAERLGGTDGSRLRLAGPCPLVPEACAGRRGDSGGRLTSRTRFCAGRARREGRLRFAARDRIERAFTGPP